MDNGISVKENDPYRVIFALAPSAGALGVVARKSHISEIKVLQENRSLRRYKIRGIISDHIPLAGSLEDILDRPSYHLISLNENPLSIYLHHGGSNAVYYDLVGDTDDKLEYIEVVVEAILPNDAFRLARGALNEILDSIARSYEMPLVLRQLDLLSLKGNYVIAHEIVLPFNKGIKMGPLGGIHQPPSFAPYEALFREAITTTSPFYRLLCACRIYEGINWIRRWIKTQCNKFNITDPMPSDPKVDAEELQRLGFKPEFTNSIHTANDLFGKLKKHRDSIAHFLLNSNESHVYVSQGEFVLEYSLGSSVLLHYANKAVNDLRNFYNFKINSYHMRGSILPEQSNKDKFIVKNSNRA